ncbi:hypothetical protein HYT26_04845 [Candidatus Pacearchaeota archaeon]|nr:hypothetical protein [Candidatus Pacearchaeota archaeon]
MEDSRKDGYIAGAILLFLSIVILIISWRQGLFGDGVITGVLGLFLGLAGIGSFISPSIAETVVHWIKGLQRAEETRISQNQNKSVNSPQTGIIKGNQNIYYGKDENKTEKRYNKNMVKRRLNEIKSELVGLKESNYKEGSSKESSLKKEVIGIIHRVYLNNPEAVEKRLIHKPFWIATESTKESEYQSWYLDDVNELISTIGIILREMDLK